jgi:hypothetical protein
MNAEVRQGDAADAMLPHHGQGANTTIEGGVKVTESSICSATAMFASGDLLPRERTTQRMQHSPSACRLAL